MLYTIEFIAAAGMAPSVVILTLLVFLEIALAVLTVLYIKYLVNKSAEHMQSIDEKPPDVENIQRLSQIVTDGRRNETQEFNEGIKKTSEALMNNQILLKLLMDEEINHETMKMIYGTAS